MGLEADVGGGAPEELVGIDDGQEAVLEAVAVDALCTSNTRLNSAC